MVVAGAGVMAVEIARVGGVGVAGVAEAGVMEAGVVGVAEGELVVAETGVAGEESMEAPREVLEGVVEETLEVVVVVEMVAEAWEWLDKRLLAGFGLDVGCITEQSLLLAQTYLILTVSSVNKYLFVSKE